MKELILASHNQGKLKELKSYLAAYDVDIVSAAELTLPEPEETEDTFHGNAEIKALAASQATGKPALSDDSGLACYGLDGAPGVYSADWAGPNKDFEMAMEKVANELQDHEDHRAAFISVLALVIPGEETKFYEGRCEGTIVYPPRGENGFGYDPIFIPEGYNQTFGELGAEEKAKLSHRAKALAHFKADIFQSF